jgi:hypothetical protein
MNRPLILCFALLSVFASARPLWAQAPQSAPAATDPAMERARAHFKLGVDLYREGNPRAALIEFKRAYKASPNYKLLYNLAQASLELQEDSNAIEYFTTYLREGGEEIAADRRREVEETLERLKRRLATIILTVNQAGAEVFIDDTSVGVSPLREPVKVSVGRRKITATKPGFDAIERSVDVAAGDHLELTLSFKDKPAPIAQAATAQSSQREDNALAASAWMGIGTGVLAAGAITMTILTATAQKAYDDEREELTTGAKLRDLREDAQTKALIADVAWGATAAAAVVTGVLLFIEAEEDQPNERLAGLELDLGPTRIGLSGRF